jgi:tetratricopeptide (TPR) repeat protein
MRGIRTFLASVYGLVAASFLCGLAKALFSLHAAAPSHSTGSVAPWMQLAGRWFIPAIIVVYGMASLTYFLRRPSARIWGVLAGWINLLLAGGVFALLRNVHAPVARIVEDQGLLVVMGIVSIFVFSAWRPAVQGRTPQLKPRVKGDGTHALLDAVPLLLSLVGYIGGMNLWYRWAEAQGLKLYGGWGNEGWFWPGLLLASLITTFVHECGHALAARLTGMQIRGFAAGPLQWRARSGRWEFAFRWSGLLSSEGATKFDLNDPALVKRNAIAMVAAGPIANLYLGAAATWFALNAVGAPWQPAWLLLAFLSTFSLIAFVVNLIPARTAQTYTDGAKIWQLLSGRRWEEFHGAGDERGTRYKGLQCLLAGNAVEAEAHFRAALGDGTGLARESHVRLLVCLADSLQDQERFDEAKGYLETALALGDETGSGPGSMSDVLLLLGSDPERALAMANEAYRQNVAKIRRSRGTGEDHARVRLVAREAQAYTQMGKSWMADVAIGEAMRMVDAELAARSRMPSRNPQGAELVFGRPSNDSDDLLLAYSCYLVGRSLRQMERDDRAIEYLRTARDLDPKGTIRVRAERDLERMDALAWR